MVHEVDVRKQWGHTGRLKQIFARDGLLHAEHKREWVLEVLSHSRLCLPDGTRCAEVLSIRCVCVSGGLATNLSTRRPADANSKGFYFICFCFSVCVEVEHFNEVSIIVQKICVKTIHKTTVAFCLREQSVIRATFVTCVTKDRILRLFWVHKTCPQMRQFKVNTPSFKHALILDFFIDCLTWVRIGWTNMMSFYKCCMCHFLWEAKWGLF